MKITDKLIERIITKIELKISKKENKISNKNDISKRLKLYRDLLDRIDSYRREEGIFTLRHYRYFTLEVDDIDIDTKRGLVEYYAKKLGLKFGEQNNTHAKEVKIEAYKGEVKDYESFKTK
jgi:hypothetical protein